MKGCMLPVLNQFTNMWVVFKDDKVTHCATYSEAIPCLFGADFEIKKFRTRYDLPAGSNPLPTFPKPAPPPNPPAPPSYKR